jgi:hypothetical protein
VDARADMGVCFSETQIFGIQLPMKIGRTIFDCVIDLASIQTRRRTV